MGEYLYMIPEMTQATVAIGETSPDDHAGMLTDLEHAVNRMMDAGVAGQYVMPLALLLLDGLSLHNDPSATPSEWDSFVLRLKAEMDRLEFAIDAAQAGRAEVAHGD